MNTEEFLAAMNSGAHVEGGSEAHLAMHGTSQRAIKLCMEINNSYHEPNELRALS